MTKSPFATQQNVKNPFAEYDAQPAREKMIREAEEYDRRISHLFLPFDPEAPIFKGTNNWLVEGFLPAGSLVLLAADAKEGKTDFATALAMSVALGKPFLGMPTNQSNVLWIAAEESSAERYRAMNLHDIDPDPTREVNVPAYSWEPSARAIPFYTTFEPLALDTEAGISDLQSCIHKHYAGLVIVDPLYGVTTRDLANGAGARRSLALLKQLTGTIGATVIILHQSSRAYQADRPADSVQLAATVGMHWTMGVKQADEGRQITLRSRGRGDFANRVWQIISPAAGKYGLAESTNKPLKPTATLAIRILNAVTDVPTNCADVAIRLGEPARKIEKAVSRLAQRGELVRHTRTKSGYRFSRPTRVSTPPGRSGRSGELRPQKPTFTRLWPRDDRPRVPP